MGNYDFTLTFALGSPDADIDELVERLGDAGCDDAVVGVGRRGRLALGFARGAGSAAETVAGALADVRRAVPDATLIEASPDLVGLTDVAALLHVSRQNVRKLLLTGGAAAPPSVHEGRPTIWRLAKVLRWLQEEKHYPVPPELFELARLTMQVNIAVDVRDADQSAQLDLMGLLA